MKSIILIFFLIFLTSVQPATKEKVTMSDTMTLKKVPLVLNGLGVRKATWLKVRVYVGGLYLREKSKDHQKVLGMKYPKFIRMSFVRSVSGKNIKGGWTEAFQAALNENEYETLTPKITQLNNMMGDVKKGQDIELSFLKKGVEVVFNGQKKGLISGTKFSRALLSVWFINARDKGLRDGLLGLEG